MYRTSFAGWGTHVPSTWWFDIGSGLQNLSINWILVMSVSIETDRPVRNRPIKKLKVVNCWLVKLMYHNAPNHPAKYGGLGFRSRKVRFRLVNRVSLIFKLPSWWRYRPSCDPRGIRKNVSNNATNTYKPVPTCIHRIQTFYFLQWDSWTNPSQIPKSV